MTSAWECADTRQALGVYVLGAIDPAERSLVDAHISGCPECRDELAGLAGLPALLSRVGADEVGRISREDAEPLAAEETPREDFVDSLVSLTAARRRRARRWQVAAAAAAVVLAAGGTAAGLRLASGPAAASASAEPAPPASWQTARTTSVLKGVNATIRYQKLSWGVAYDVQITGVPAGTTCQLWVTNTQGVHLLAAGWTVTSSRSQDWFPGSSWVPKGQVKGMDVTAGNEQLATFTTG
ncbi:MAG TPA: zf-HC2 domain-containing protein [Streptosporangiaceae bacterium]|jgi:predicted anti-sigma-YlaC factor YlaD|nr:zf-HC2 domain-containing protein [Streptosporangiaceae bacterium]